MTPRPRWHRWLALGLLLALIALVTLALALPAWRLHRHYDEAIEQSTDMLLRYRRVAALRPSIDEAIASVEKSSTQRFFWKGSTPALVAADIQGEVTRIVESSGARIFSSYMLPASEDGKASGPTKTSISVQMTASIVPLQLILHSLESHEPYLFIDQISIRNNQGRSYRPMPGIQPEFVVQLTARGYTTPPAGGRP